MGPSARPGSATVCSTPRERRPRAYYYYRNNRHLGLITAPLIFIFLRTTFFTIHLLSKRPEIYKIMAKTLLIIFPPVNSLLLLLSLL